MSVITGKTLCEGDPEELISCPFDSVHMLRRKRMPYHIIKCGKNFNKKDFRVCPFNYRHVLKKDELEAHLVVCQDRGIVEREMIHDRQFNTGIVPIQKGYTDIPISTFVPPEPQESWDDSNVVVAVKPRDELFGRSSHYGPKVEDKPPPVVSQVRPPPQPRMPAATGAVGSEVFKYATQPGPSSEPIASTKPNPLRSGIGRGRGRGSPLKRAAMPLLINGRGMVPNGKEASVGQNGFRYAGTSTAIQAGQQHGVPQAGQEHGMMTQHGVIQAGQFSVPQAGQHGITQLGQCGAPQARQHGITQLGQCGVPQARQHGITQLGQCGVPQAGQHAEQHGVTAEAVRYVSPPLSSESKLDADKKKERKLKKMLRQIIELEEKQAKGQSLDEEALTKITRKEDVVSMLKQIL